MAIVFLNQLVTGLGATRPARWTKLAGARRSTAPKKRSTSHKCRTNMTSQASPFLYRRTQWRLVDKLRIADSAKECGWIKRTACIEGTFPNNVRRWMSQRDQLFDQVTKLRAEKVTNRYKCVDLPHSRPSFGAEVDKALLEYYRELRAAAAPVSVRILVTKWTQLDPDSVKGLSVDAQRFRMYRFMKRHRITRRVVTHQAQNKYTCTGVINDFVEYINIKIDMLGITWNAVANFDETNVYFAPELRYTLADKGSRTVCSRKPNSSNRCSAMLGCTATGKKLPPFIIWQGSSKQTGRIIKECDEPEKHGLAEGMFYGVQEKAWMDEKTMLKWIAKVWKPFTDTIEGPTMLIIDEAPAHLTHEVRRRLALLGTELEVIPGGYTSKLQVMDVGLNKPFKDKIRHCVENFIVYQPVGEKPRRSTVSEWIKSSWDKIDIMTIQNTWRHIGYTTHGIHVQRCDLDSDRSGNDTDTDPGEDPIALAPMPTELPQGRRIKSLRYSDQLRCRVINPNLNTPRRRCAGGASSSSSGAGAGPISSTTAQRNRMPMP